MLALVPSPAPMERVEVNPRGGFRLAESGVAFEPRGFNYDHDERGRLIEDYWVDEWAKVEEDFAEMRDLGANVVRVHLQFGRFCPEPGKLDATALERLGRLLALAERVGLYLDLTGLGCYHKADVPTWYDALDEAGRWDAQAAFWTAVAKRCRESPAVFCYDLMNEPVVPGGKREAGEWLGPAFAGKHFVQFVTLDQEERPRPEIARAWLRRLVRAIREIDRETLITVGLVDWSLDRPGLTSGFVPSMVAGEVDFLAVHLYPERGKVDEAITTLAAFAEAAGGKPLVVEETFPLKASGEDFAAFLRRSREHATGWIGFYWGATLEELRAEQTIGAALTREWLERFRAGW
jgi:endo-1,4-beta-mannosidase